jgi:hypothetical protein
MNGMKAALLLAALLLGAQQQTFYSATAKPKPVPAATAQPVNPEYLYYCAQAAPRRGPHAPCAKWLRRPRHRRPAPHHT